MVDAEIPPSPSSGPALKLLAGGLNLWIRSQCDAVNTLELQLHGSALQVLRGRLQGVSLIATQVVYQGMAIARVELRSEAIQVKLGPLIRSPSVTLEHPFRIHGQVAFSAAGLGATLRQPRWQALADSLAEQLLGITPLAALRLGEESVIFSAGSEGETGGAELETRAQAMDGSLGFHSLDGTRKLRLPMDPNIRITAAGVEAGQLQLQGEALVSP